ncbi:hypothetical protein [Streptomyces sp. NPDC048639]|uniref:hypothetical protein n=1 Tax=Streptomyces sp. NPDC048639 TaxID=3365581 RepID=UPI0037123707
MSVDPTDPETFEDDLEQPEEIDVEAPEADAVEQHAELVEGRDAPLDDLTLESADPADAAEQARVVEQNEDDYR